MNLRDLNEMDVGELLDSIRNLDPNNIGSWPLPARLAVFLLLFAGLLFGGYHFVIKDLQTELEKAQAREPELKQEFETKQKRAANLNAYKAQLEEMRRSFGNMLRQLPSEAEVDDLVVDISQTVSANGLEQHLLEPKAEIQKDFYAELPYKIRVTGTYHEFGLFASDVAALPRIVTLHNIEIGKTGSGSKQLEMTLVAKTYRYIEQNNSDQAQ